MPLLSKVVNLSPLLNSGFLLIAPRINGVGACRLTVKEQCLIPPLRRLFTHLATPKKNNVFLKKEFGRVFSSTFKTKPFATPKAVAKFHGIDGLSPKSFTLIYKTDFQWYLIIAQTTVLLALGSIIVVLVSAFLDRQTTPEQKAERAAENRVRIMENEKATRNELKMATGMMEPVGPEVVENLPSMADVVSEDLDVIGILFAMLAMLGFSIFRLMTLLPLRIYVGKKHHCVGIYYGSLIPGKLVRQEFVAGTVKAQKSMLGAGNAYYKDGSGRGMMLFEHHFRKPADLHYLTGVLKSFDFEEEDELSQLKRMGEYGTDSKR